MSEQKRRAEATKSGGEVISVTAAGGEVRVIVKFQNRGDMNEARRKLVGQGWRVVSDGVTLTATAKV